MKALILNSGLGTRMGVLTSEHPKCMTEIFPGETILSRQLKQLTEAGIDEIIITTGYAENVLMNYCRSLDYDVNIKFVNNPDYKTTNYIYSIYLAREFLNDDLILMHGDLVFENEVIDAVIKSSSSVMTVSSTLPLPEKDFKAVIDDDGKISKVGVEFFTNALTAQPLYKLNKDDWNLWLSKIEEYCVNYLQGGGGTNFLRGTSIERS
ncbi:MAG: NTP transferase domain-containing protein [Synergistaceae bacterium]|nr:NTP transferase domain-containing protein [Synergistaceae bacterium]